jgi:hypothetical protein
MNEENKEVVLEEPPREELVPAVPQKPVAVTNTYADELKADIQFAKILATSTMMPRQYQGNVGNCMVAVDMAKRMGNSPFMVAQNLDIIQGNPCWKSTAAIALINNCGRFEPLEYEFEHNEDWTEFSGYAYAKERRSGKICKGSIVDKKMCVAMGWWDKNGSFWKKMPEQMLVYRTSVFFARKYCPEALMGLYTVDEQRDITGNKADEAKTIVRLGE